MNVSHKCAWNFDTQKTLKVWSVVLDKKCKSIVPKGSSSFKPYNSMVRQNLSSSKCFIDLIFELDVVYIKIYDEDKAFQSSSFN